MKSISNLIEISEQSDYNDEYMDEEEAAESVVKSVYKVGYKAGVAVSKMLKLQKEIAKLQMEFDIAKA